MGKNVWGLFLSGILLWGCQGPAGPADDTAVLPSGEWRFLGLRGEQVSLLEIDGTQVYAGTKTGLYHRDLNAPDTAWSLLGLGGKPVRGLVVFDSQRLLVAGPVTGMGEEAFSLYRTTDGGGTWHTYQNGFGGGGIFNQVAGLAALSATELLAVGGGAVARSDDGGASWSKVWGDWESSGSSTFVATDPNWPDLVWCGGQTGFFMPFLLKSSDGGRSWSEVETRMMSQGAHYTVAVDPVNSARVFSGMLGRVVRSTDGGQSWQTVLTGLAHVLGLAVSPLNPERVYAAGGAEFDSPEARALVLHVSVDGGVSWEAVVNDSVQYGGVHAMLLTQSGDGETVYLGTEEGVYTFVVESG